MPVNAAAARLRLHPRILRAVSGVLAGVLLHLPAVSGVLTPEAGIAYLHDDNILRTADASRQADTSRQLAAGIVLDAAIGAQAVTGSARLTRVSFDRLRALDHDAKEVLAAWNWHLGSHVSGNLGASYSQVLAPYVDIITSQRNLRVQQRRYADGAWLFHPRWQVRAGISRDTVAFELPALRASERVDTAIETGIDYLAPGSSTIGLQLRQLRRDYPTLQIVNGQPVDNANTQHEAKFKVDWNFSAMTRVQFLGGWVRRTQPAAPERDARGPNGRLITDWLPSAQLRFTASLWREFGAIDSPVFTSSENRGQSVAASWQPRPKVQVNLQWRREARSYQEEQLAVARAGLDDVTRGTQLSVAYAPRARVQLSLAVGSDSRRSNTVESLYGLKSYRSYSAAFNAVIRF